MRIAIIGTGVSGSLVARLLATRHDVTVYESNGYPGGHANTVEVELDGRTYPVDTGFMVFNRRTYPQFCRLLELLEIASQDSDMSFSVGCERTGLEYQGSSLNGLFAQRRNLLRPSFWGMLGDILRFNRRGMLAAERDRLRDGRTVNEFLRECGVGRRFVRHYLVPMAAAIWSSDPRAILEFPARFMIGFFANHGLMQLRDRPLWRTIVGGSRRYIAALLEPIRDRVRLRSPVTAVQRCERGVSVTAAGGQPEDYDEVVFASHADQTLRMLTEATPAEQQILRAFPYQPNQAVLHTDIRMLPRRRRAWASWNYQIPDSEEQAASVTYDLSRLQNHHSSIPILLTLNPTRAIEEARILRVFDYAHPAYSRASISAQARHREISGRNRTHYCGAYWGYGFHEDGVCSALEVAAHFGLGIDACKAASITERSLISASSR
ncbi:MAG: FAD-dependent oxidoreductase [Planctomycetes bacterium]|nr:FAD-dependent oxidoreductase [Planctomycetota bacterium]